MRVGGIALLILLGSPASAVAQEDAPVDLSDMAKLAAAVAPQLWYPEGYYDVRIAAEAQVAETPRSQSIMVGSCPGQSGSCYNPFDPIAAHVAFDETDPALLRYGNIALETSRIRQEMVRIGYPETVYAGPLADFERKLVEAAANAPVSPTSLQAAVRELAAAVEANRLRLTPTLMQIIGGQPTDPGATTGSSERHSIIVRASGPSAAQLPLGTRLKQGDKLTLKAGDRIVLLDNRGTRTLQGPGVFAAVSDGSAGSTQAAVAAPSVRTRLGAVRGRGADSGGIIVATSPPGGEVLLVTAFAFKLCTRKQVDMWDRFACKWNEVETGIARPLSGRYVYQVRWPDGTVRKGTREILPAPDDETATTVTFKKSGS